MERVWWIRLGGFAIQFVPLKKIIFECVAQNYVCVFIMKSMHFFVSRSSLQVRIETET